MPKIEKRYWYVARRDEIDALSASDVMDMLRYDAARVECNPPSGFYLMSKLEQGGYLPPSIDRWKSFHVRIYIVGIRQQAPGADECVQAVRIEDLVNPPKGGVR
jgi:hypothetical protein